MLLATCLPINLRCMRLTRQIVVFSLLCTTSFLRTSVRPNNVGYAVFGVSGMMEATDRSQSRAIYLRGRSLSAAQTVWDHRATQLSHQSCPNLCCLRKTSECRNTRQTIESDSRTQSCAVHLSSRRDLCAARIPIAHKVHRRFAGNRCNDNQPKQLGGSSTRIVSRHKRIHH